MHGFGLVAGKKTLKTDRVVPQPSPPSTFWHPANEPDPEGCEALSGPEVSLDQDEEGMRIWAALEPHRSAKVRGRDLDHWHPYWRRIVSVQHAGRSQFEALRLMEEDCSLPTLCLAGSGLDFQGQRGRFWAALPGNIHLSATFLLPFPASTLHPLLIRIGPIAVVQTLRDLAGTHPLPEGTGIKWINDVLLGWKKVAGTLVSTRDSDEGTRVVLGIGVNVQQIPGDLADQGLEASCLRNHVHWKGKSTPEITRHLAHVLGGLLATLHPNSAGFVTEAYRTHFLGLGTEVELISDQGSRDAGHILAQGTLLELHPDLSLTIRHPGNRHSRGRLRFLD